jgi:tetratricopeptide (TPR) repeat protein
MQKWIVALALVTATAVLVPDSAQAQDETDDRAKEMYQNGADLYNEGRYEEAIVAWEEAYRLSNRPKILFNIANAYERMGDIQKALDQLFRYKIYAKADEREQIERRIRMLEARLDETPAPDPVPKPDPVRDPVGDPSPAPVPRPKPEKTRGGGLPAGPIVLMGGGVAVLGAGAGLGVVSASAKKSALTSCVELPDALYCSSDAQSDLNRHRTTAVLADVSFAVGAIAVGTGVVLLATSGGKATLGVGPNSIRLDGRF